MNQKMISYDEALLRTLEQITPIGTETIHVLKATDRIVAEELHALVDSPSLDVSLKDGYAIQSTDIANASPTHPVLLRLLGVVAAGDLWEGKVTPGTAVRILSGAPIPLGAQAVVSEEFASDDGRIVKVTNHSEPKRNILCKGTDVTAGEEMIRPGIVLCPTMAGLLAASGHKHVLVRKRPRIAIIATGNEVIAPGTPMDEGKLYASNLITLSAWCQHFGMITSISVVRDLEEDIEKALSTSISDHDAILTSGGAWKGDRDLVVHLLERLGWKKVYHRVRIGPGKAIGFGLFEGKPVFCLPGGPPSNHMAFLQLALPGLHQLAGAQRTGIPTMMTRLDESISGQKDWTQFIHGHLEIREGLPRFRPIKQTSRLQMMAHTTGIAMIPEGTDFIPEGASLPIQVLSWPAP
jgi:molybdopterin molybdotransferase